MEKTKKLLTRLSQNRVVWLMVDKDSERDKKTIEFQKEVDECLEEIKTCEADFISLNNSVERSAAMERRKRSGDDDGGHDPCYG